MKSIFLTSVLFVFALSVGAGSLAQQHRGGGCPEGPPCQDQDTGAKSKKKGSGDRSNKFGEIQGEEKGDAAQVERVHMHRKERQLSKEEMEKLEQMESEVKKAEQEQTQQREELRMQLENMKKERWEDRMRRKEEAERKNKVGQGRNQSNE